MGIPIAILVKYKLLIAANQTATITPMITTLLWPFLLKLFFSFRPLHEALLDITYGLRLFLFQMGQIAFGSDPSAAAAHGGMRWERALRLVYERLIRTRHPRFSESEEESLRALSVLAL
ncbi:hypothetical protein M9H77_32894 [Catharanthus roseus]|uniref:Uncharacterized protein n=1 Tax=Catharanthus roseus TaxID=4058 RepID=A0ACC0A472_CATRO|nr:hypothetical protein M9H77_32894 [Catharanthus roseus]